eukprot:GHVL01009665.1.p1 GENE.GHVL01009665.1~~GHVL01009665.1.p1  ORF type:complete len:2369 (-),score=460.21 GHVL01009665.1:72-7178(-)
MPTSELRVFKSKGCIWEQKPSIGSEGEVLNIINSKNKKKDSFPVAFTCCSFDDDGKIMGCADRKGSVYVFYFSKNRYSLIGEEDMGASTICFVSKNHQQHLLVGYDKIVKVHCLEKFTVSATLQGHNKSIVSLAVSKCAGFVVTASADVIMLWDCSTWLRKRSLSAGSGPVLSVEVSPEGEWVVAVFASGRLGVWETSTFSLITEVSSHKFDAFACTGGMSFGVPMAIRNAATDGKFLLLAVSNPVGSSSPGMSKGSLILWDVANDKMHYMVALKENLLAVGVAPIKYKESWITAGILLTDDGVLQIAQLDTFGVLATIKSKQRCIIKWSFDPQSKYCALLLSDGSVEIRSIAVCIASESKHCSQRSIGQSSNLRIVESVPEGMMRCSQGNRIPRQPNEKKTATIPVTPSSQPAATPKSKGRSVPPRDGIRKPAIIYDCPAPNIENIETYPRVTTSVPRIEEKTKIVRSLQNPSNIVTKDAAEAATKVVRSCSQPRSQKYSPSIRLRPNVPPLKQFEQTKCMEERIMKIADSNEIAPKTQQSSRRRSESCGKLTERGRKKGSVSDVGSDNMTGFEAVLSGPDRLTTIKRLRSYLSTHGQYPEKFRAQIWEYILQLPRNSKAFDDLCSRGLHPTYWDFRTKLKIKSNKTYKRLEIQLTALTNWCSIFAHVPEVPPLIFPFIKVFLSVDRCLVFEIILSFLLQWTKRWFDYYPNPPEGVLNRAEVILQATDFQLFSHLECKLSQSNKSGGARDIIWSLLINGALSEVLERSDWLTLWDHLMINWHQPWLLIGAVICWLKYNHRALMNLTTSSDIKTYVQSVQTLDMRDYIRSVYALKVDHPSIVETMEPPIVIPPIIDVFKSIKPAILSSHSIPLTCGEYPLPSTVWPQLATNEWKIWENEKNRALNELRACKEKKDNLLAMTSVTEKLLKQDEEYLKQQQAMTLAEQTRRNHMSQAVQMVEAEKYRMNEIMFKQRLDQVAAVHKTVESTMQVQKYQRMLDMQRRQDILEARTRSQSHEMVLRMRAEGILNMEVDAAEKVHTLLKSREEEEHDRHIEMMLNQQNREFEIQQSLLEAAWQDEDHQARLEVQRQRHEHEMRSQVQESAHEKLEIEKEMKLRNLDRQAKISKIERERLLRQAQVDERELQAKQEKELTKQMNLELESLRCEQDLMIAEKQESIISSVNQSRSRLTSNRRDMTSELKAQAEAVMDMKKANSSKSLENQIKKIHTNHNRALQQDNLKFSTNHTERERAEKQPTEEIMAAIIEEREIELRRLRNELEHQLIAQARMSSDEIDNSRLLSDSEDTSKNDQIDNSSHLSDNSSNISSKRSFNNNLRQPKAESSIAHNENNKKMPISTPDALLERLKNTSSIDDNSVTDGDDEYKNDISFKTEISGFLKNKTHVKQGSFRRGGTFNNVPAMADSNPYARILSCNSGQRDEGKFLAMSVGSVDHLKKSVVEKGDNQLNQSARHMPSKHTTRQESCRRDDGNMGSSMGASNKQSFRNKDIRTGVSINSEENQNTSFNEQKRNRMNKEQNKIQPGPDKRQFMYSEGDDRSFNESISNEIIYCNSPIKHQKDIYQTVCYQKTTDVSIVEIKRDKSKVHETEGIQESLLDEASQIIQQEFNHVYNRENTNERSFGHINNEDFVEDCFKNEDEKHVETTSYWRGCGEPDLIVSNEYVKEGMSNIFNSAFSMEGIDVKDPINESLKVGTTSSFCRGGIDTSFEQQEINESKEGRKAASFCRGMAPESMIENNSSSFNCQAINESVNQRQFSMQDEETFDSIQKDTKHLRMSTAENSLFIGEEAILDAGPGQREYLESKESSRCHGAIDEPFGQTQTRESIRGVKASSFVRGEMDQRGAKQHSLESIREVKASSFCRGEMVQTQSLESTRDVKASSFICGEMDQRGDKRQSLMRGVKASSFVRGEMDPRETKQQSLKSTRGVKAHSFCRGEMAQTQSLKSTSSGEIGDPEEQQQSLMKGVKASSFVRGEMDQLEAKEHSPELTKGVKAPSFCRGQMAQTQSLESTREMKGSPFCRGEVDQLENQRQSLRSIRGVKASSFCRGGMDPLADQRQSQESLGGIDSCMDSHHLQESMASDGKPSFCRGEVIDKIDNNASVDDTSWQRQDCLGRCRNSSVPVAMMMSPRYNVAESDNSISLRGLSYDELSSPTSPSTGNWRGVDMNQSNLPEHITSQVTESSVDFSLVSNPLTCSYLDVQPEAFQLSYKGASNRLSSSMRVGLRTNQHVQVEQFEQSGAFDWCPSPHTHNQFQHYRHRSNLSNSQSKPRQHDELGMLLPTPPPLPTSAVFGGVLNVLTSHTADVYTDQCDERSLRSSIMDPLTASVPVWAERTPEERGKLEWEEEDSQKDDMD